MGESHDGQDKPYGSLNLTLGDMKKVSGTGVAAPKAEAAASGDLDQKWRLFEKRLDYGWKFFDFHARQRMSMFNFFLIFIGFIFAGYGTLFKDGSFCVASGFAFVGATLTFVFIALDRRNEELVNISEDLLFSLETDVLFDEYDRKMKWPHRRGIWKMRTKEEEKPAGIFRRQAAEEKDCGNSFFEHGRWIPLFQVAVIVTFLGLAGFAARQAYAFPGSVSGSPAPPRTGITVPVFVTTPPPSCPTACPKTKPDDAGGGDNKKAQPGT